MPDPPIGLDRGSPGQARVRTLGVVIGNPPAKASPQLGAGLEGMEIDALVLQGSPKAFDDPKGGEANTLSIHRPRPSMLIRTSASRSMLVKACDVNWLP